MQKIIETACIFLLTLLWIPSICLAKVTVTADSGVPYEQVSAANDAVMRTEDVIYRLYGLRLNTDVTVSLRSGTNPDNEDIGGNAAAGKITIWSDSASTEYKMAFLIAHELTHQYQIERVGKNALNKNLWFTEGMSDLIGVQAANIYDRDKAADFMNSAREKGTAGTFLLSWVTRRSAWMNAYQKGLPVYAKADLAVLYLASHYSLTQMWAYLYALADNPDADKAMQATYGMSIKQLDDDILKFAAS